MLSYCNDLVGRGAMALVATLYNRLVLPGLLHESRRGVISRRDLGWVPPLVAVAGSRLAAIPLGVDLERFTPAPLPAERGLRLAFLALLDRWHRYKGLDLLLAAIAALPSATARVELEVAGEGEERRRYERLAADLGLASRVRFRGRLSDDELPGFFRRAHLFALPSTDRRQEGFGLVALEAMACGRPVLVSRVPAMAEEIAAAGAGWVVDEPSVENLARALAEAVASPQELASRGARARALVARSFTWDAAADSYLRLFAEVCRGAVTDA